MIRRFLSKLGLRPDDAYRRRQQVEDVLAQAHIDYINWIAAGRP